ncbi:ZIP family metal transporter [Devosia limi]|uniref:Zinc transporter ZupT n=2 Tax=Devosia limi DSM 17137 TaxID=1121477 RepID=A0A1M5CIM5_9HYPH|nr:metal transporter [Devosia limi]SHF54272.1 Zinc transporter ZupT [Devosia limi DSM 17137]
MTAPEMMAVSEDRPNRLLLLWLLLPLTLLGIAIAWIASADPLRSFDNSAPPVEAFTYERTILDGDGIRVLVRAGGSEPMKVAQVQVDDAYWMFTQDPPGPIARGSTVWLRIPYPWVLGEAHAINIVTDTGATFLHEIPVAVPTPVPTQSLLWQQALIGLIVGVLPVAIGLLCYPALRGVGVAGMNFILALTVGLLAFLLVDMSLEALEMSAASAVLFQGPLLVLLAGAASFMLLMAIGRWRGAPAGLALSFYIALGIGLHNFGEGLAIGAAFAAGSAGLGTFLVLGFAVHNVTEGIGIAAPILKARPPLWSFVALTLLAGAPAVVGLWIGSLAYAPQWSALFLGIGAGAIAQVIVEVTTYMTRTGKGRNTLLSVPVITGFLVGVAFMYVTAAAIKF